MSPIKIWSGIPAIRNLIQLVKMMSTGGGCQLLRFSRPRASYIFREIRRWKAGNPDQMMDNYRFICSSSWNCPVYALTLSELKRTHECWYYEISMRTHLLILTHSACSFDHVSQMCSFSRDELLPSSRFDFDFQGRPINSVPTYRQGRFSAVSIERGEMQNTIRIASRF